jgi:hypothetical protein
MKFATEFHNISLISYNSVYEYICISKKEGQGKKLKELLGKKNEKEITEKWSEV